MTALFDRLRHRSAIHTVELIDEGLLDHPVVGREADLGDLIREAMNAPIDTFVILPARRDGPYEHAHVIPLV